MTADPATIPPAATAMPPAAPPIPPLAILATSGAGHENAHGGPLGDKRPNGIKLYRSVASCKKAMLYTNAPSPPPWANNWAPMVNANALGICASSIPPQTLTHQPRIQRACGTAYSAQAK